MLRNDRSKNLSKITFERYDWQPARIAFCRIVSRRFIKRVKRLETFSQGCYRVMMSCLNILLDSIKEIVS
jgi:hypothetical protein